MITEVTKLLGIQYPVIQGGMAWVAEHHLAAAVSEAGGLGLIGASAAPAEWVRNEIREAKKLTDKPFGVNIMLMSPYADEVAKVVAEEGVKVVTTGAGNPEKYMELWKNAGIRVIPVVASVALARRMERAGADAVHVVISKNGDRFPPLYRKAQPGRGPVHILEEEGVHQKLRPALQEGLRRLRRIQAAAAEYRRQKRRISRADQRLRRLRPARGYVPGTVTHILRRSGRFPFPNKRNNL